MFDFLRYYEGVATLQGNAAFQRWCCELPHVIRQHLDESRHGRLPEWVQGLSALPRGSSVQVQIDQPIVTASFSGSPSHDTLTDLLRRFGPWRKGPFAVNGVFIDSEWRSDMKWQRLQSHIASLKDRLVLDVGCGNGYHCWRAAGAGARAVIGVDPTLPYVMQFLVLQHFIAAGNVFVLPIASQALPENLRAFDTAFSMGVLYHRRSPLDHLLELHDCLRPGGELVLETLVIDASEREVLTPVDRYAGMKNVWFIPSCGQVLTWLRRCGFSNVRLIDISPTTRAEQRATAWSGELSLANFLQADDSSRTVEGYPAPTRAIFLANRPMA